MRGYRFFNKQGYFDPEGTKYPYGVKGNAKAEAVVAAGYRLSRRKTDNQEAFPYGYYLIYRRLDGKLIGRAEKDRQGDLKGWKSRHWFFGGGTTCGTFRTLKAAALHALKSNATLGKGWDQ